MQQTRRSLVQKLDFLTSAGSSTAVMRASAPAYRQGSVAVITDLCIFEPDPATRELMVASIHPGIEGAAIEAATGWPCGTFRASGLPIHQAPTS